MRWALGGNELTAQLNDDLQWSVTETSVNGEAEMIARHLNFAFDATADLSPASGTPGFRTFHEAVSNLHATVLVPPTLPPAPEDTIY